LHFGNVDGVETRANLMHSVSELDKSNSVLTKLVNDRNSINIKSAVPVQPRRSEEPMKHTKKKAKPGESTRPRPKDRQQIQDCIKELRGIIPHGGKVNENLNCLIIFCLHACCKLFQYNMLTNIFLDLTV
jgi:hypothetical protein